MARILLLHHAQGRTAGVLELAEALTAQGHEVSVPDLYLGETFDDLDEGVAHMQSIGAEELFERAESVLTQMPPDLVYVGMSMGAGLAVRFVLSRPGARGAVLLHGAPWHEVQEGWPEDAALQVHYAQDDPWIDDPEDVPSIVAALGGELFVYPGSGHLLTDRISSDYDAVASALIAERTTEFLAKLG